MPPPLRAYTTRWMASIHRSISIALMVSRIRNIGCIYLAANITNTRWSVVPLCERRPHNGMLTLDLEAVFLFRASFIFLRQHAHLSNTMPLNVKGVNQCDDTEWLGVLRVTRTAEE
jgi:hypothetical protein